MAAEIVYRHLASCLDALPNGFPSTPSGVELRILARIFTPEEATVATRMLPVPEPAGAIARRIGRPADETEALLRRMADKGEILAEGSGGAWRYALVPFVIGIYEFQLPRMDRELAELLEEYLPQLLPALGAHAPAVARVVPVNARIDAAARILPHESVREMIREASSFRLMPCICRTEQAVLGSPCSHPLETCLAFSRHEGSLEEFPPWGRPVTRNEALAVAQRAEQEGLVHCTYNVRQDPMFLCNCCPCCCGLLRGLRDYDAPHVLARSNFVAAVIEEDCVACGECLPDRCPMGAIVEREGAFVVRRERCIGCGVCTVACPAGAITLEERPGNERTVPPRNVMSWALRRATSRFGPIRALEQLAVLGVKAARGRAGI